MLKSIYLTASIAVALANDINIVNLCPFKIWPGIQGNDQKGQPEQGGFELDENQSKTISVAGDWGGRIWGRTDCDENGMCATGDCGNRIQCDGAGGVPPVSLAEITFNGAGGLDYYDVSLVDGYNLPISMKPNNKSPGPGGQYDCTQAGCVSDLNANCPDELAIKSGDATIACKSACLAFDTDEYCCRGDHGTPDTCKSTDWPVNYSQIFKEACPDAYSYAYDDQTSTFTCPGPDNNYDVTFCPS